MDLTIRGIAIKILRDIFEEQAYSNIALDKELKKNDNLTKVQKSLITCIVYGTITYQTRIDNIIKYISTIKFNKIESDVINIIRIAIYQLIYMDNSKDNVVINESTEITKELSNIGTSKFVNAILRRLIDTKYDEFKDSEEKLKQTDRVAYISSITSHPLWIVRKLLLEYPEDFVMDMLMANNDSDISYIRVNTIKTDEAYVTKVLNEMGNIEFEKTEVANFIKIRKGDIVNTPLFKDGYITIQDISPGIASILLDAKEGELVLDGCSSPGGKTSHIAMLTNDKANIYAFDIYEHRLNLVDNIVKRLGINSVKTVLEDTSIYNKEYSEMFDRILLDVPCSGLGVIRKKTDIKQKRKPKDIEELVTLQKDILYNAQKYLKLKGRLIYSTCTILKEENEDIITEFLRDNTNFKLLNPNEVLDKLKEKISIKGDFVKGEYIKLYPNVNDADGFFIAILERVK